jgi:hypothetical protein
LRKFLTVSAAVCMVIAMSATALAVSPSEAECEAAGGTFSRDQGTVSCVIATSDPVGNSENSGGKSQTVDSEDTETSQGNTTNETSPHNVDTSECRGPGQGNSTAQCP